MSGKNDRHIVKHPEGWAVKKPNAERASVVTPTQKEAIERAKVIVRNQGGGEAVTHGRDRKIRDPDTVKPAKDPFPPRDKKH